MPGTKAGGAKCAVTNTTKYGEDYYSRIGKLGGAKGRTGGFYHYKYVLGNTSHISEAGRKGGRISRRGKVKV